MHLLFVFWCFQAVGEQQACPAQCGGRAGTHGESKAGRAGASGMRTRVEEQHQGWLSELGAVWRPPGKSAVTQQVPARQERAPGMGSAAQARTGREPNRSSRPATRLLTGLCFPAARVQVTDRGVWVGGGCRACWCTRNLDPCFFQTILHSSWKLS